MDYFSVFVLVFVWTTFANGKHMQRLNSVILADINENIEEQNLSKKQFLEHFVDNIVEHTKHDVHSETQFDAHSCTSIFNATACRHFLLHNCYDVKELLQTALVGSDEDFNITDTFPTLLYYVYKPQCTSHAETDEVHGEKKVPSSKAWGYGIGFCLLICFISNVGGLLAPLMEKRFFQRILLFCVALAVATLAASGFLVLIPESMQLGRADSPIPDYRMKMTIVMAGVYFFYVSELLMKLWLGRKQNEGDLEERVVGDREETETLNNGIQMESIQTVEPDQQHGHTHFPTSLKSDPEKPKVQVSTVAWMILIGDALHNFVDGISIGAAFTENIPLGISVSLAVLCEELPHELGDIAILLHSGLSMKRALLYNFLAAVVVILGLVVGIQVGERTDANTVIFALAGGMFIYIALVDMLPEMREQAAKAIEHGVENPKSVFVIQNLGLIAGFCIIASLVFFY